MLASLKQRCACRGMEASAWAAWQSLPSCVLRCWPHAPYPTALPLAPGSGASPAMVQLECFVDGSHITTAQVGAGWEGALGGPPAWHLGVHTRTAELPSQLLHSTFIMVCDAG